MYINCTGGRNPSNIVTKLVSIGVNGNWYLTGKGKSIPLYTHTIVAGPATDPTCPW